jgi:branched-chain amino acid transport system substrate-binding protein
MNARRIVLTTAILLAFASACAGPAAAQKYDVGASATEIRIGNTMPYTGPASAYGLIGKVIAAYFNKINAEGGINGRKITFISYDDAYNPAKTVEFAHQLVESDKVLLLFATLGTATSAAIRDYVNANKVPQLFVASGATKWDDPANFPWTMGFQPSYQTEGRIYAQYLMQAHRDGKIAVLFQNDEYGNDLLKSLKEGLRGKIPIVAEVPYQTTDTNLNAQIAKLKASGADVFVDVATPKFAAMAIRRVAETGWKPIHIVNAVSNSVSSVLTPAGLENSEGLVSAYYVKDPDEAAWKDDPAMREFVAFLDKYYPSGGKSNTLAVYGYVIAQTMVQVLKQCGDDLTRENIMRQAANLKSLQFGMLLPGVAINTSAADFSPLEQMQMMRFTGGKWERFGDVLSGIDPGAVSEGFKTIFRYNAASRQPAAELNANTVTMMTGTFGGTYIQVGADLATVLDNGENLRVLPVVGRGSVQAIADILLLKGVDAGIIRSDTLEYLEANGYADALKNRLNYIIRLYNEEMHVVAPKSIRRLADLDGKTVAVDLPDGGTFVTSITVFERLHIRPHFLFVEERIALEKLRKGEIDAIISVEGKPLRSIAQITDENLHLVPVSYDSPLQDTYLPAQLTADDYPNLIKKGERVDTIAVAAVLAAYNWAPGTDRSRRLTRFVDALFSKIKLLQQPPFHPKWKEVALNATIPGWTRFRPAQEWLEQHAPAPQPVAAVRDAAPNTAAVTVSRGSAHERDPLFQEFLEWKKKQPSH